MTLNLSSFTGLVTNAALLLSLGILYELIFNKDHLSRLAGLTAAGFLAGIMGIAVMLTPWEFSPGIVFDTRSILLCITALFFGAIPASIACIMTAFFRIWQGGAGMYMGVGVIASSTFIGLLWRHFRKKNLQSMSFKELLLLGFAVHVTMILLMFALPAHTGLGVVKKIGIQVLLIYPVGTALLGRMISARYAAKIDKAELKKSEARYRSYLDNAPSGIFIAGRDGRYIDVNRAACAVTGYSKEELLSMRISDILWPESLGAGMKSFNDVITFGMSSVKLAYRHKDGSRHRWAVEAVTISDESFMGFVTDITAEEQIEQALVESEKKFRDLYQSASLGIFHSTFTGKFIDVNPALADMLGYDSPEEAVRTITSIREQVYAEPPHRDERINETLNRGGVVRFETRYLRKNGEPWTAYLHLRIIFDKNNQPSHLQGFVEDISGRKNDEKKIEDALKEKELLLKELYHRTKNNMQIIHSMLRLQAGKTDNEEVHKLVRDTGSKIQAMAFVHQMLYQSENLSNVNIREYADKLISFVVESFTGMRSRIAVNAELENIQMPIDIIIPVGLVLNECITNSLKHAFPDARKGSIGVSIAEYEPGHIRIQYTDDGVGFPQGFDPVQDGSIGLKTVFAIVENQLQGSISFTSGNGISYIMEINNALYKYRI